MSARCFTRQRGRRLVCEGSAVGEYAGRPLKAGDAAQPRGCSARFVPAVFGPVWICCWFWAVWICLLVPGRLLLAECRDAFLEECETAVANLAL